MDKHGVIHKTGTTQCVTMPPEKDRAMAKGNMHKIGEGWSCDFGDICADRKIN